MQKDMWLTRGTLAVTGHPMVDKEGLLVITGGHLGDTAGPLTKLGSQLAVTRGTFANTRGNCVSGELLVNIGDFSLKCY